MGDVVAFFAMFPIEAHITNADYRLHESKENTAQQANGDDALLVYSIGPLAKSDKPRRSPSSGIRKKPNPFSLRQIKDAINLITFDFRVVTRRPNML